MKKIYLAGLTGAGKTTAALSILLLCKERNERISYLKPKAAGHSVPPQEDLDAQLIKKITGLGWTAEKMAPLPVGPIYIFAEGGETTATAADMEQVLDESFSLMAEKSDTMVIEGGRSPCSCFSLLMDDLSLSKKWGAPILFVSSIQRDDDFDQLLFYNENIISRGLNLAGNILNNISPQVLNKARTIYKPMLEKKGIPLLGIIPEDPALAFPTVKEFYEALEGEMLTGQENTDLPVEEIVIGTMTIEGALRYLRQSINKAVVTGGDRSDMALTALETSTSVLILTGGLYPDTRVIVRAQEKGIPVILVPHDTYTTMEKMHNVAGRIRPGDTKTITHIKENFVKHCSWEEIKRQMA